jgi:hypothetical protein
MNDKDWAAIEGFVQDIILVKNNLASETYIKALNERLQENCDAEETIEELKKLAKP